MQMEAVGQAVTTPYQGARYNGKELEQVMGVYAYGFRHYDPTIGRFTGADPIADQFPWVSVFNYAENEPVGNVDLHGLQKAIPPVGAVIGGTIRAGYEQLKYSIWRNLQDDPSSIPYREYGVEVNEYTGEAKVAYKEFPVEPSPGKRLMDNSFAGLDLLSIIPTKGAGVQAFAKTPASIITGITKQFANLQCVPCADAVMAALKKEGISAEIVTLQANSSKRGFIWSDTAGEIISTNGHHRGVLVDGKVYDNIHKDGIDYNSWLADFAVIGGFKE